MPPPTPPISQRLRTVRRRVTIAVLATFAAAWLAVAAFGKGGTESGGTATSASPQTAPSDDGGYGGGADSPDPSDSSGGDNPAPSDSSGGDNPAPSDSSGGDNPAPSDGSGDSPAPLTTSQS